MTGEDRAESSHTPLPEAPSTAEGLAFERFVSELSSAFATAPTAAVDETITHWLQRIVEFLGLGGATVARMIDGGPKGYVSHRWQPPDVQQLPPVITDMHLPWIAGRISRGEVTVFTSRDELPPEAAADKAMYERIGVVSLLEVPLIAGGRSIGSLGLGTFRRPREWPEHVVKRMTLVGQIMGNALARREAEESLRRRLEFEHLLSDLLSRLARARLAQRHQAVELGLKQIVEFLGIDRSVLYEVSEEGSALSAKYSYARPDVDVVEGFALNEQVPWLAARARQGQPYAFSSPDELPDKADADRHTLTSMGVQSGLIVPVLIDGAMRYVLTLAALRAPHAWPADLSGRLRMAATVLGATLAQQESCVEIQRLKDQLQAENLYLRSEVRTVGGYEGVVGQSEPIRRVLAQAEQVAGTGTSVLILGETGTGKELLAHVIHDRSARKGGPFVTVNLASLPSSLLESELFGREKGAYTGALTRQTGRFEAADGGTIFLDEIGEMPSETQAKLLRVLQQGEFERLGSTRTRRVDVRIIAATNRDLDEAVRTGAFREDLFYRINVFPIRVPPLRDRRDDIPLLVWSFVRELGERMGKRIERIRQADMDALQSCSWPGNVRELRNVVERSMIMSTGPDLQLAVQDRTPAGGPSSPELREVERQHILDVLTRTGWRVRGAGGAAELLGLKPTTLESRMKKHGLRRPG